MSKTYKIGILCFLLLLALLSYLEASQPEPVNWYPSYSASDKIPLGTHVLFENLKDEFQEVRSVVQAPFEFLTDSTPKGIYFFVNNQLSFDEAEVSKLLSWVEKGNTLFVASDALSKSLLDTLHLNVATLIPSEGISSKPMMNLVNEGLKNETAYLYEQETYHSIFSEIDSLNHSVLGVSQIYSDSLSISKPEINYLKADFGEGEIFLHTTPQAFSNFFVLYDDNADYIEKVLGYLPLESTLYWDEYYKSGKDFHTSSLYILFSKKSLKWAYTFVIIGAVLFIVFEGKRKQRSIPVREPLENQTYNFTRTISGMYLDRKDYKAIASKKIQLFLEYVRVNYRIPTAALDQDFLEKLAAHSGSSKEEVQKLFQLIQYNDINFSISKEKLMEISDTIDVIKIKKNGK